MDELAELPAHDPTLAATLDSLIRRENLPPIVSLSRLVRRLLDGKASPAEEKARPILEWLKGGWPRTAERAHFNLGQRDRREAEFFLRRVLRIEDDPAVIVAFFTILRRSDRWRKVEGFALVGYLRRAVWHNARKVRERWNRDHLPRPSGTTKQSLKSWRAERRAALASAEPPWADDGLLDRIAAGELVAPRMVRARLSKQQRDLWVLMCRDGITEQEALERLGYPRRVWTSLVEKARRAG